MKVIRALSFLAEYAKVCIADEQNNILYSGLLGDAPHITYGYGRTLRAMFFDPEEGQFMVIVGEVEH